MKKRQFILTGALILVSLTKTSFPVSAQPVLEVFPKADLPDGGTLLPDPAHKQIAYYYLERYKWKDSTSKGKPAGLYGSTDAGKTWQQFNNGFEFSIPFVHPVTGELFAVVPNRIYETGKDGFLYLNSSSKVISSVDGKHWKDLMQRQPPVHDVLEISLDPDHPTRIRLRGHAFRGFYWVAVDDNYSDWKFIDIPTGPVF